MIGTPEDEGTFTDHTKGSSKSNKETKKSKKMNNKEMIYNFLNKRDIDPKQRIKRDNGGQYLDNFLIEFAKHVKQQVLIEVHHKVKQMREEIK